MSTIRPPPHEEIQDRFEVQSSRGRYGKGYKPDTHDTSKDPTAKMLFGARTPAIPAEFSLESFVDKIHDQGQTSSCVGFAFAGAVMLRCTIMGTPIPWPSPTAIYTVARAIDRKDAGQSTSTKLKDEGSMPNLAVRGMNEWGIPADSQWPVGGFDPAAINAEPDLEELESAACFKLSGYYRIDTYGASRVADVCHAISENYPVSIGVMVDQAFEDYEGNPDVPLTSPEPDSFLGGHMLCIVGYKNDPKHAGKKLFRIRNQWNTSWGDNGFAWADESFITNSNAGDLYVITVNAV